MYLGIATILQPKITTQSVTGTGQPDGESIKVLVGGTGAFST